jgi:hypothetical protein
MRRAVTAVALLAFALPLLGAASGRVSIVLPAIDVPFKAGAGVDAARANCETCHSAAYVYTQPRLTQAQWTAEVTKMKAAYGAPIADADVPTIVAYLVSQNGKP